jgi:hypothetical protein
MSGGEQAGMGQSGFMRPVVDIGVLLPSMNRNYKSQRAVEQFRFATMSQNDVSRRI